MIALLIIVLAVLMVAWHCYLYYKWDKTRDHVWLIFLAINAFNLWRLGDTIGKWLAHS